MPQLRWVKGVFRVCPRHGASGLAWVLTLAPLLDSCMTWGTLTTWAPDSSSIKWESWIRCVPSLFGGDRFLSLHEMHSHTHNFINNFVAPLCLSIIF